MRTNMIMLLCGCLTALFTNSVSAQPYRGGGWGGGGGYHASTAAEGAARGMADVIRSQGAANMMNSEAAINVEEARRRYIDNRQLWTNTYFQMRKTNREARAAERGPKPTQEQMIRVSQSRMPDRISTSKLDPLTGTIKWPVALQGDEFADSRKRVEELMSGRAERGLLLPKDYVEVKNLTDDMTEQLRKNVANLPSSMSIEARNFLKSLNYEAQFEAG